MHESHTVLTNELFTAIRAALLGSERIARVYEQEDFETALKGDDSPLTRADRESHEAIVETLEAAGNGTSGGAIPILSEEGQDVPYEERRKWQRFWLVDPLDGTKEFIKRNGEFTVNIALVDGTVPVLGIVAIPVSQRIYLATRGLGTYQTSFQAARAVLSVPGADSLQALLPQATRLPYEADRGEGSVLRVAASRSHMSPETQAFIDAAGAGYDSVELISAGSSLKMCLVAEGGADLYPRLGPTMEWDTAAAHVLVECAGGSVVCHDTGVPLTYNKPDLHNPWFVVRRYGLPESVGAKP
jgi:3'(2'), 5'-bisphosphate nucleotidase